MRPVIWLAVLLPGCSRFVWNEEPFTPDAAPATEIVIAGRDTTYVLRGPSYYLLTSQRSALWNRETIEDVAWRYRSLFGDAPPLIAVGLDSAGAIGAWARWRGVPLTVVPRPPAGAARNEGRRTERADRDSATARLLAGPMLAATAADAWLKARTMEVLRTPDSQPGGPTRPADASTTLPAWLEAGALRLLASPGAADRATAEVRANVTGVVPLATLFAVQWPTRPNAGEIAGLRPGEIGPDVGIMSGTVERPRPPRDRVSVPGVAPLFIAQSASVVAFIRERDPSLVGRLADELTRGRPVSEVLATSTSLPRDVAGLEAEWTAWLKRAARRR